MAAQVAHASQQFLFKEIKHNIKYDYDVDENGVGTTITYIGFKPLPEEVMSKISKKYQLY